MLTRKKSIKSRTRRARRKQTKFLTPDLALFRGQKLRFVAGPDDPLREAERLRAEFAQMVADREAKERQFLQRAYFVAVEFRWRLGDFKRFQVHPFWKQTGQKPKDPSTSKWVLYLIMQATTTDMCKRADKYAVILDGLMQDQVEISAVAARIKELGGIDAAYEAMRVRKRGDAQVTGSVAVAETAAAGRRTRRHDERSPRKVGESLMPTKRPRRRRPQPELPMYPLVSPLFGEKKIEPPDPLIGDELLAVEEVEGGCSVERVPAEAAFDFVQRRAREYAKIKDGDHQSVRRVLQRAYLAARKMQREPDEFKRLQADPFWKASFYKPKDASTSKWVLLFIMQARTLSVRYLAGKYAANLDGLMRDKVGPDDLRVAKMEGVEAAYEAVQNRQRLRGSKLWSRRQGGSG
jgi:hypothetical protein